MKTFITVVVSLLVFLGVFYLDFKLINWLVAPLTGTILVVVRIALWAFTFGTTLALAIFLGVIVAGLINENFKLW